jgi:predicted porin
MKKLLIATAALAMVAGTAQAQSSVTVYGAVGASSTSLETNGVKTATQFQDNARDYLSTTNLGFTGTEVINNDVSAFFRLEGDLSMSGVLGANATYVASAAGTTTNIFNRHAHVGLTSKQFGTFSFGRQNDSVKDTEGLRQTYNLSDNLTNNTVVGDRIANSYKYATPVWNGLSATYTYSNNPTNADQTAADGTTTHNSFAVNYKLNVNGGVDLAYAKGTEQDHAGSAKVETTLMSARTTFMGVTVGAGLAVNKDQSGDKLEQTMVSLSKPFGQFEAKAHYVKNKQTGDLVGANLGSGTTPLKGTDNTVAGNGYGLMAVYNLSKRTAAYVGYADFSADVAARAVDANIQVTTVGLVHKF